MNLFAVRDDDTSYYTSVKDLESAYSGYWGRVPISLAVIPFSVAKHRGDRIFTSQDCKYEFAPISENKDLVSFLKEKVALGHVEIMLHGFTHEFKEVKGKLVSECIWKTQDQILKDVMFGKKYLEDLFDTEIKTFVPPANDISVNGIKAIRECSLSLSGMMGRWGDRPISINYIKAWVKRWGWRVIKGFPYPYALDYDRHIELYAHALNPFIEEESLIYDIRRASSHNANFVVATHYWAFEDSEKNGALLRAVVNEAERLGFDFSTVTECISGRCK